MSLVFFGHFEGLFRGYLGSDAASLRVIQFLGVIGHQGVCFFLTLSGYFVYRAYLDRTEDLGAFVLRRVRRIYPPYIAMLGVYLVLSLAYPVESKIPAGNGPALLYLASNLLMVSSRPMITVSWTISTLLALYTLLPWFWRAVRFERWKPGYRVCFIVLAAVIWLVLPRPLPMLDGRAACVLVGFALYEANQAAGVFTRNGDLPCVMILGCGYVLWYAVDRGWLGPQLSRFEVSRFLFLAPGLFYFCGHVIARRGRLAWILEQTGLPRLGRISYAYYLCHGLTLKVARAAVGAIWPGAWYSTIFFWGALPALYGCTLLSALAWHRLVEAQLLPGRDCGGRAFQVATDDEAGAGATSTRTLSQTNRG
jgi:peptidoglycan/LPS O-acetylase OafA/YrhL